MKYHKEEQSGFTLLIAVVLTAVLLLISTSLIALAVRQAFIADAARQSQLAFYAADTGMECALYWDVHNPVGNTAFATTTGSTVTCNQDSNNSGNSWTVGGSTVSTMANISFLPSPTCATVTVTKYANGTTIIEAKGYNTCAASARRVERAVRATY
jgi:Tfp pilus assembly protein PilX